MSSASDYMVGNAPAGASYAAPLVGQQLGNTIAQYPADYYKGQQMKRQLAVMNAFPNGIPMDPTTGQPDVGSMLSTLAQAGGGQYVQGLMPFLINSQANQGIGRNLSAIDNYARGGTPPGTNAGPGTSSVAAGPANLTPRPQQPTVGSPAGPAPTGPMPQLSSAGMDTGNDGPETLRQIMSEGAGGRDVTTQINSVARTLRLNPDAPLTPQQAQSVRNFRSNAVGLSDNSGQQQQPPQETQAVPQQQQQQLTPDTEALQSQLGRLRFAAAAARQAAARAMAQGSIPGQQAAEAQAKSYDDQANAIQENLFKLQQQSQEGAIKEQESTPEMKNATRGATAINQQKMTQEQDKLDAVRFDKVNTGIQASADAADHILPHLQLAKSLMNQPSFYSGAGEGTNLAYKRFLAAIGQNPNVALPQEAFRKVMAANILDQVAQLKAETAASGGSTRIFQSQIQLMEKAAQNPDNSIAANRLLTEIGTRMANRSLQIDQMARDYASAHGHLDNGFMNQLRQFNQTPIFTADELRDPRLIAPPEFSTFRDAAGARLPSGTPVKVAGQIKWVK